MTEKQKNLISYSLEDIKEMLSSIVYYAEARALTMVLLMMANEDLTFTNNLCAIIFEARAKRYHQAEVLRNVIIRWAREHKEKLKFDFEDDEAIIMQLL